MTLPAFAAAVNRWDRQRDGLTDARPITDPAPHTMWAQSKIYSRVVSLTVKNFENQPAFYGVIG